uniref:Uncharacterized protein n=1 Tax=Anguilla anguilla TaxID=7936 RepID=A0A0E9V3I8_ANGAN
MFNYVYRFSPICIINERISSTKLNL